MGAFLLGALGGLVGGLVAAIVLGGLIVVVLAGRLSPIRDARPEGDQPAQ